MPEAGILDADRVGIGVAVLLVVGARAVERDRAVGGRRLARLEHLLERRAGALGDLRRRRRAAELARHLVGRRGRPCTASSCRSRGTRTDQPLSRKWRLSSPRIVGTANDENAVSRAGSKRSIALSRPSDATWTRSSSCSPPRW